jgi:hypothetical protein
MKTNKVQRSKIREIHSMHELQLEKARLQLELVRTEDKIKGNYRHILSAFSLRNIFTTVTDLTSPTSIVTKAFTLGKNWLSRRNKKRKEAKTKEKAAEAKDDEMADAVKKKPDPAKSEIKKAK